MAIDFHYVGEELDLFAAATNWKGYLRTRIDPYLGPEVLEVGAGFGGTTRALCTRDHARWACLEPDPALGARLADSIRDGSLPACCEPIVGTLETLDPAQTFNTLLYIDVMEHIEDDAAEMSRAAARLKPGGHVVILSPAHPFLFTPFDEALGHFRRYTRKTLARLTLAGLEPVRIDYLDSVGMLASLGNRLVLQASMPKPSQIAAWDKVMVPFSKLVDPLTGHRLGKSILGVWRRPGGG